MDLVIMAAGIGSRFGGLKQLQSIDDNNNFIIDYSIFDAVKAGFDHIVFIIKEELLDDFKSSIGNRIEKFVKVDYVFQDNKNIPDRYFVPKERVKPFGTGHAILCAKEKITGDFAVINADDFYGRDSFVVAAKFLKQNKKRDKYSLVGYKAENVIGNSAKEKRGVCKTDGNMLINIIESIIERKEDGTLFSTPIDIREGVGKPILNDRCVSMNLFVFTKDFLDALEKDFFEFLEKNKDDLSTCEFCLPTVVTNLIDKKFATVDVLSTTAEWYGLTYKDDVETVKTAIEDMVNKGIYTRNLWS